LSEEDKKLIRKAFDVSRAHKEQRRKSGEAIFSILLLWQNSRFRNRLVRLRLPPHYYMMVEDTLRPLIERIFNQK
jgi:hypothetical protein